MHAADIIAWAIEGAIYCDDCAGDTSAEVLEGIGGPVFADGADGLHGHACGGSCGRFLAPDLDWDGPIMPKDGEPSAIDNYRWSACKECNHQRPHDETYAMTRRASWQGQGTCPACGGVERF